MLSIFISSTFNDMQAERDVIHQWVLPRLRRAAASYGESVRFLDLRWGVNTDEMTEEESSRKVMDVCLKGIDRCDSYMVCLLGERYGWVPDMVSNTEQISVTEMEIGHGIFQRENADRAILFFRDGIDDLPEELKSRYVEKNPKLDELKRRLEDMPGADCHHYRLGYQSEQEFSGTQEFAERLLKSLTGLLERIYGFGQSLTGDQRLARLFQSQIREKSDAYLPVLHLEEELERWKQGSDSFLVIQAESGMGKSSFMARLCALPPEGIRVIPFFCGMTPECSQPEQLVHHLIYRISELVGWPLPPEGESLESQVSWLTGLLYALQEPVWLVIDGLDQLTESAGQRLSWLPRSLPDTVRVVMTVFPGDSNCEQLGEFWPVHYTRIPELTDHGSLIRRLLDRENKEISEELISLASERAKSGNYLYISMLVRALMLTDRHDFTLINERGGNIGAIRDFLRGRLFTMPEDLAGMSMFLMYECADQVAPGLAYPLLSILASSPVGLRPQDMEALLPGIWEEAAFERLAGFLHGFLSERENGCYDFTHRVLRKAAVTVMQAEEYVRLTEYLMTLSAEDPLKQAVALPYLLAGGVIGQAEELILVRPDADSFAMQFRSCLTDFTPSVARLLRRPEILDWFRERLAGQITDAGGARLAAQLVERIPEPAEPVKRLKRYQMLAELKTRCMEERAASAYYEKILPLAEELASPEEKAMLWLKACEMAFVDEDKDRKVLTGRLARTDELFSCCELSAEGAAAWMRCRFLWEMLQLQEDSGMITYGMMSMTDYLRGKRETVKSCRPYLADLRFLIRIKEVDEAVRHHLDILEQMVEESRNCLSVMEGNDGAEALTEMLLDVARLFAWVQEKETAIRICEWITEYLQDNLRKRYDVRWLLLSADCYHIQSGVTEESAKKIALVEQACRIWERFFNTRRPPAYAADFKDCQLTWAELCLEQEDEKGYEEKLLYWAKIAYCMKESEIQAALEECRRYPDELHQDILDKKRRELGWIRQEYIQRKWLKTSYHIQTALDSLFGMQKVTFYQNMKMNHGDLPYPEFCRVLERLYLRILAKRMECDSEADAEELKEVEKELLIDNFKVLIIIRLYLEADGSYDDFDWAEYYKWVGNVFSIWKEYADIEPEKKRLLYMMALNLSEQMIHFPELRKENGGKMLELLDQLEQEWEKEDVYKAYFPYPEVNLHKIRGLRERAVFALGEAYREEDDMLQAASHFLYTMDLAMELVGEVSQAVSEDQMHLETAILAGIQAAECMMTCGLNAEAENMLARVEAVREAYLL